MNSATYNIYRNVRYYNERGRDFETVMNQITALRNNISNTNSIEELMGVEGNREEKSITLPGMRS